MTGPGFSLVQGGFGRKKTLFSPYNQPDHWHGESVSVQSLTHSERESSHLAQLPERTVKPVSVGVRM